MVAERGVQRAVRWVLQRVLTQAAKKGSTSVDNWAARKGLPQVEDSAHVRAVH